MNERGYLLKFQKVSFFGLQKESNMIFFIGVK